MYTLHIRWGYLQLHCGTVARRVIYYFQIDGRTNEKRTDICDDENRWNSTTWRFERFVCGVHRYCNILSVRQNYGNPYEAMFEDCSRVRRTWWAARPKVDWSEIRQTVFLPIGYGAGFVDEVIARGAPYHRVGILLYYRFKVISKLFVSRRMRRLTFYANAARILIFI